MAEISCSVSTKFSDESSIRRGTANYHGNVWHDDFILSLNSPYGAPGYYERAGKLIEEIKHMLLSEMEDNNYDLIKRLQIVDTLECLGIDRHFQPVIKTAALDYVYRYWNEKGIAVGSRDFLSKDLNTTALGFRALRLHRYNVSAGVLENFKDGNGKFFGNYSGDKEVRSMLSLLRASEISFPGEKVMEEAKAFTREYLNQVLAGRGSKPSGRGQVRVGVSMVLQWWRDSEVAQVKLYRRRHVEYYFWANTCTFEPEFSESRIAFAKLITVATVLDDLYDIHGTLEELKTITEGVRRWDLSLMDDLPEHIKVAVHFFFKTANEFAVEVAKKQGRDMTAMLKDNVQAYLEWNNERYIYMRDTDNQYVQWQRFLESYLQEAEWIATAHVPTFNEYIKNARRTTGMCIINLISVLLMGELLPNNILEEIHYPSKIQKLIELTSRLIDDLQDFEVFGI
eukprot:PITA_07840